MPQTMKYDTNRFRLGSLCKRGHAWPGTSQSLRRNKYKGVCIECEKIYITKRPDTPEAKQRQRKAARECNARVRQQLREQGLTKNGTVPVRVGGAVPRGERNEAIALQLALQRACQSPTVIELLARAQRLYWRENPGSKPCDPQQIERRKVRARVLWRLEYQISPDLRLYHREKSRRRKAQDRGQMPLQVPVKALRQRFNDFGNRCAYCGQEGDMQIEHVEPISEGGAHDIGNIVPACWPCNSSKRTSEMEPWYRQQPFFSELRLQAIRRVVRRPEGAQLALALA